MTKKAWIIFGLLTVALLAGMVWLGREDKTNVDSVDPAVLQAASAQNGNIGDHYYGNKDAKVVLIEYGDFQCPGCGTAAPIFTAVREKYKDNVLSIFRSKPLTAIHPNALAAAAAAEAAGLQNKYWEMHDLLYSTQDAWSNLTGQARTDYFATQAASLGLDGAKFANDVNSDAVRKKISFDDALSAKAGVTATPSFYLNGKQINEYYLDDKLVPEGTKNARQVWTSADAIGKFVIEPALKDAGIK